MYNIHALTNHSKLKNAVKPFLKEKLNDTWFRIIGIPVVALLAHVLFFYHKNPVIQRSFFIGYLHSVFHAWILWEIARQMMIWTRNRFSTFEQSTRRINYTLVLVTLSTILSMGAICAFYDVTMFWGYHFTFKKYVYNIFVALMYAGIVGAMYEGVYFFRKWREAFVEAEALKQANLQSQLESLKGQINPHFLFNSLSCLSSLIVDDCKRAEKFVDELAAVYRYLLRTNERELTTLYRELEFINAYFHLLKTRFNDGIQLCLNIDKQYLKFQLPPLTLQILIENAVKHNTILQNKPLKIHIYSDQSGHLVITNNLQKKHSVLESGKTGLANISRKYNLLKQPDIGITETDKNFIVQIPLIKNDADVPEDLNAWTVLNRHCKEEKSYESRQL